jgi:hypothetical protein
MTLSLPHAGRGLALRLSLALRWVARWRLAAAAYADDTDD